MNHVQTELQTANSSSPTPLEFLQVIDRRGSDYFKEEHRLYKSLQAGDEGERKLLQYLFAFGQSHWTVLRNVWLKEFKTFECDVILLTRHCLYIFEVKNYRGTFAYHNGHCFYNGIETPLNPFEQVRASAVSVRNSFKRLNIDLPVKAAVVFTGEDNEVFIESEIKEIEVIPSNGIRNFIERLIAEERQRVPHTLSPDLLIQTLARLETVNPFLPAPLSASLLREIKGGMYCANCMSFDLQRLKSKIRCACGLEESLDEALVRTICEYSVLTAKTKVRRKELLQFLDRQVSLSFLKNTLSRHFTKENKSSQTAYAIKPRLYENSRGEFTIKEPRTFYHQNGERTIFLSGSAFSESLKH